MSIPLQRTAPPWCQMFDWARAMTVWAAVFAGGTTVAHAHPDVERGVTAIMSAEFEAALIAFDEALVSGTLTRADLIQLLGERVLVFHALGRGSELAADLSYLAALDPSYELGRMAPPPLHEMWSAAARGKTALTLDVRATAIPGGVRLTAVLRGNVPEEAPQVVIAVRPPEGTYREVHSNETEFPAVEQGRIEYYAQAVGMGGAVVAQVGSPAHPVSAEVTDAALSASAPSAAGALRDDTEPTWLRKHRWWIAGAGAALVAVAGAVTAGLLVGGRASSTEVAPTVDF